MNGKIVYLHTILRDIGYRFKEGSQGRLRKSLKFVVSGRGVQTLVLRGELVTGYRELAQAVMKCVEPRLRAKVRYWVVDRFHLEPCGAAIAKPLSEGVKDRQPAECVDA